MKEEIKELKKEVEEVKGQSFAVELLKDMKKQNKRLFIIWVITFIGLILSLCYILYLHNDIGIEEITIDDVETIDKSNIQIGDK